MKRILVFILLLAAGMARSETIGDIQVIDGETANRLSAIMVTASITNGILASANAFTTNQGYATTSWANNTFLPVISTNGVLDLTGRKLVGDWTVTSSLTVPTLYVVTISNYVANVTNLTLLGIANANGYGITNMPAGVNPLDAANMANLAAYAPTSTTYTTTGGSGTTTTTNGHQIVIASTASGGGVTNYLFAADTHAAYGSVGTKTVRMLNITSNTFPSSVMTWTTNAANGMFFSFFDLVKCDMMFNQGGDHTTGNTTAFWLLNPSSNDLTVVGYNITGSTNLGGTLVSDVATSYNNPQGCATWVFRTNDFLYPQSDGGVPNIASWSRIRIIGTK